MKISGLLITADAMAAPVAAHAAPMLWASNGHYYEFVDSTVTWNDALNAAQSQSFMGMQGYLATVTSLDELDFITNNVTQTTAYLSGSDAAAEGVWRWMAGPEAGQIFYGSGAPGGAFSNWNIGEPNNLAGENGLLTNYAFAGGWNDINDTWEYGYIVEYSAAVAGAVPEPATWLMLLTGIFAVGFVMRRQPKARPAIA